MNTKKHDVPEELVASLLADYKKPEDLIGENDAVLREQVCNRLAWTGLRIDAQRNRQADGHAAWAIHAPDSRVEIWVVPTDEGRVAAREAAALLESGQALDRAAEK